MVKCTLVILISFQFKSSVADLKTQATLNTQLLQSVHSSGHPDEYALPDDVVLPVDSK